MHITERLGLGTGRPVTAYEGELLSAFEDLFIEEDFLFLRWGPSISLTSDSGTTLVSAPRADRFSAEVMFVLVPTSALSPAQVKNVVAFSSAVQEAGQKLVVIERLGQPLLIACQVELQRPYTRDSLSGAFTEFAINTDLALGEAVRRGGDLDDTDEFVSPGCQLSSLRFL
jgi:hypothetical protein